MKKKLKVLGNLLPSTTKQNRYPWRHRSNNGFFSTAMEKQFSLRKLIYLPIHIVNQENAFLDKFGEEFNCCRS
jgi:hypothetical protein